MFFTTSLNDCSDSSDNNSNRDLKGCLIKGFLEGGEYFSRLEEADVLIWHFGERSSNNSGLYYSLTKVFLNSQSSEKCSENYFEYTENSDIDVMAILHESYDSICSAQNVSIKNTVYIKPIVGLNTNHEKKVLGFILVASNMNEEPNQLDLRSKVLTCNYAQLLLESRHIRKYKALEFIKELTHEPKNPEDLIVELIFYLKSLLSVEKASLISFQGKANALDLSKLKEKGILSTSFKEYKEADSTLQYKNLLKGPISKNYLKNTSLIRNLQRDPNKTNLLLMPFLESSYCFEDTNFCRYEEFIKASTRGKIVNFTISFEHKKRLSSISQTISETDIEISKTAGHQFASYFSNILNDKKRSEFVKKLQNIPSYELPSAKEVYELTSSFFKCKSVLIFRIDPNSADKEYSIDYLDRNGKNKLNKDVQNYIDRVKKELKKDEVMTRLSRNEVLYGFDKKGEDNRIEVSFHTENHRLFILAFEIPQDNFSEADFQLFYFLTAELMLIIKRLESAEGRSRMIAQVNHLINYPMNRISSDMVRVLRVYNKFKNKPSHYAQFMDNSIWDDLQIANQYANIVKNLLQSSKYLFLGEEFTNPNLKSMNIISSFNVAKEATLLAHEQISQGKKILIVLIANNLADIRVKGDTSLLFTVFNNLLDNAIKFTLQKHSASFFSKRNSDSYFLKGNDIVIYTSFSLVKDGSLVRFKIESVGPFLSNEEIQRIRLPSVRGSHAYNVNRINGTGIGLPLIEKILNMHSKNSQLNVLSQPLKDYPAQTALNTFSFTLPTIK